MMQDDKIMDPVCGMLVESHNHEILFQQMHFVFCSEQCRARFLAHPHMYIGYPGQKAPKQEGQVLLKRRRLHLEQPLSAEGEALIQDLLLALMGVSNVAIAGDRVEVTYDLLQVSLEDVEKALTEAGARLGGEWAQRLRRALIHESEEWEIDAHEVTPPHRYLP